METTRERLIDPKKLSLDELDFHQAEAVFRYLLANGWDAKGWKPEEKEQYVLQFVSPEGEQFSLNSTLYYAVTGDNPKQIEEDNIFGLMKEAGLNMDIFERLQYLASHTNYKGREEFDNFVIKVIKDK